MPATVTLARYSKPHPLVFETDYAEATRSVIILDLVGEIQSPDLVTRLRAFELPAGRDFLILSGLSRALEEQLESEQEYYVAELVKRGYKLLALRFTPEPELREVGKKELDEESIDNLIRLAAQIQLEGHLTWTEGIWQSQDFHFVVPSGEHTDLFIRLSDLFSDYTALSRLTDWTAHRVSTPCLLIADTPALLPLLQEIRLRTESPESTRVLLLPLYSMTPGEAMARFADAMPWCLEHKAKVVAFISVTGSGGYQLQLRRLAERFRLPHGLVIHPLCEANERRTTTALGWIETRRFASKDTCVPCKEESSAALEVDTQRFTAQLYFRTEVVELPKAGEIEKLTFLIQEADRVGAFRLHVQRPLFGRHLGIVIDTERLLSSRIFRAQATLSLAKVLNGFVPDLVLVPEHDTTEVVREWLAAEQIQCSLSIPIGREIPASSHELISKARRILICDAGMVTSRTMRSCVDLLQSVKGKENDFRFRGLVLAARPSNPDTWEGLRRRFFTRHENGLEVTWLLSLPDHLTTADCPWCTELSWLRQSAHGLPIQCGGYIEQRIDRLSSPEGLKEKIYFGSELPVPQLDSEGGTHTSANSYFGNLSDVGMFVAHSAMLQELRHKWRTSKEFLSTKMALPLPSVLRTFTDPIIPASMLRAAKARELRVPMILEDLRSGLNDIKHVRQHPVLLAELLYAIASHRLPLVAHDVRLLEFLRAKHDEASIVLASFFSALFADGQT